MREVLSNTKMWGLNKSEYKPLDIMNHTVFLGPPENGQKVGSWNHRSFNNQVLTKAIKAYVLRNNLEGQQLTFYVQSKKRLNMVENGPFRHEW